VPLKFLSFRRVLVATALTCAASLGLAGNVHAANLACKPDVKVTNNKPSAIKVLRFGYKDASGAISMEGLDNKKLSKNETEEWKSQKLQDVAEGTVVSAIRVEYKNDTSGQGSPSDPWSSATWTIWYTQTGDCTNSRTYTVKVG